jgi:hypothetical protein
MLSLSSSNKSYDNTYNRPTMFSAFSFVISHLEVLWVVKPESGISKDLRNVASYHSTTRRHNPEDLNFNLHRREKFKFVILVRIKLKLSQCFK